jgi:ketosteroid isomerase-like protein
MASPNIELIRALFPGKVDMVQLVGAALPLPPEAVDRVDPDFEVQFLPDTPGANRPAYRGLEGMAEGWSDWLMPYDSYVVEAEEFIEVGDDVVMLVHVTAKTHRDGVVVEHSPAAVCTIRDGRAMRMRFYLDRGDALASVGRSRSAGTTVAE